MDIPKDSDKTSLNEIRDALMKGEASAEEQEAAGQFIYAVMDLAESAIGFSKLLEQNDWVGEEEPAPNELPLYQRN